ncbi:MAG: acetoin utilization protein AcuC [Bacillota bacterium]
MKGGQQQGGCRSAYVWTPAFLDYQLAPDHPFNPLRLRLTDELIRACGLLPPQEERPARQATREELCLVHDPAYVDAVERFSRGGEVPPADASRFRRMSGGMHDTWGFEEPDPNDPVTWGLGTEDNPLFPGMHEAASWWAGATLTAAELVMEGRADHALNLGGGLHHAQRDRAAGFCIYNDIAVAISWVRRRYGARVLYVDTDAHHGDGVQWLFYGDPQVLTLSYHESGRFLYPGTGRIEERGDGPGLGYSVNVPLEPFTDDASWLEVLDLTLPAVAEAFRPDIIISQNGCDGHALDPLTHLSASLRFYREVPRRVHQLAHQLCQGRWVAVGGGGYEIWQVVPRAWAALWAEMAGRSLPNQVPSQWLDLWLPQAPVPLPRRFDDDPLPGASPARYASLSDYNRRTAERVLSEVLPLIRKR